MNKYIDKIDLGKSNKFPVYWDLKNSLNSHVALIGASGSGKSVQAQRIICEIVKAGGTVLVINAHAAFTEDQLFDKYKDCIDKYRNDIEVYDTGIPCQLFEPVRFMDGTVEKRVDTIGAITDVISRAYKFGVKQKATLRHAVGYVMDEQLYDKNGFEAIGYGLKIIGDKTSEEVYERMLPLLEHNVFRAGEGLISKNKINIVHLSKMDLTTQEVVSELLLSHVWRLANADQFKENNLFVFIDECQNMDASSNGPLAVMISEGRRMGVNLILATQMILLGTTNSVQQRISQCGLILYFKPAANRVALTARMINPSNESQWLATLKDIKVGEFVAAGDISLAGRKISYPILVSSTDKEAKKTIVFDEPRTMQQSSALGIKDYTVNVESGRKEICCNGRN